MRKLDVLRLLLGSIQTYGTPDVALPEGPPLFRFSDSAECERVLNEAGFVSVSMAELPLVWSFTTPEEVISRLLATSPRIGSMLSMQTETQRLNIEKAIVERAKAYATDNGTLKIPASATLAVAE